MHIRKITTMHRGKLLTETNLNESEGSADNASWSSWYAVNTGEILVLEPLATTFRCLLPLFLEVISTYFVAMTRSPISDSVSNRSSVLLSFCSQITPLDSNA